MKIKTDEITSVLKQEILNYKKDLGVDEVGTVLEIGDGIARVYGLKNVMSGEMVEFQTESSVRRLTSKTTPWVWSFTEIISPSKKDSPLKERAEF